MAPHGACGVAQSTARSNAEFAISKGISKGTLQETRKRCRIQRRLLEPRLRALTLGRRLRVLPNTKKACSSGDFERHVASRHARAAISSGQWLRSTAEQ